MLESLAELPPIRAMADSIGVFAGVESLHIVFIALLGGCVLVTGLAGVGLAPRGVPLANLLELRRLYRVGIAGAAVTGALLFATSAQKYLSNPVFGVKLGLLALAVAAKLLLARRLRATGIDSRVRALAAVSLLAWLATITAGRWIGLI